MRLTEPRTRMAGLALRQSEAIGRYNARARAETFTELLSKESSVEEKLQQLLNAARAGSSRRQCGYHVTMSM